VLARASHAVAAAASSNFAWVVIVHGARRSAEGDTAVCWVADACPDPVSVEFVVEAEIPGDEVFVVSRARSAPLAPRAASFDLDLFVADEDADGPAPDSFLGRALAELFRR
jgi:hypothetical protein